MRLLLPLLVWLLAVSPLDAMAQKYRDRGFNAMELAQLPKYCYAQYVDDKLGNNPEYSIQRCGAYTNHYCPGLVNMMRARQTSKPSAFRRENIRDAVRNFDYTLKYMPAGCWLKPHAESSLREARMLEKMIR